MNIKNLLKTTTATLCGVAIGVTFSTFLFINEYLNSSYQAFVVQSGSMEPAVKAGSLIIIKSQNSYKQGDIITFNTNGNTVTHRIHAISYDGNGKPLYKTIGDANEEPDGWTITLDDVVGRQYVQIPYLGYLSGFVRTPRGFIIMVIIPATIIIYEETKTLASEIRKFLRKKLAQQKKRENSGIAYKWSFLLPVMSAGLIASSATGALFYDLENTQSNLQAGEWQTNSDEQEDKQDSVEAKVVINEVYYNPDKDHILESGKENDFE